MSLRALQVVMAILMGVTINFFVNDTITFMPFAIVMCLLAWIYLFAKEITTVLDKWR